MSKKGPRAFLEIRAHPVVNVVLIILALPARATPVFFNITHSSLARVPTVY